MFCTKCGAQIANNSSFCTYCGAACAPVAGVPQRNASSGYTPYGNTPNNNAPAPGFTGNQMPMNEFFPCGLFQPPGIKVFGVIENAVVYGQDAYPFETIDSINKQNDSTAVTNGVYQMRVYGQVIMLVYKHADRDRAIRALEYARKRVNDAHGIVEVPVSTEGLLYDLEGVRGRHVQIYEDRAVLSVKASLGSFITGNISDGEKTIYFTDCIGVQFKESGLQIGYLQFETAGRIMNNSTSNFFNENTFTWDTTVQTNEFMRQVAAYVKERVSYYKQARSAPQVVSRSPAEELKQFKELLDMGIITQEEFDRKKQQILGF